MKNVKSILFCLLFLFIFFFNFRCKQLESSFSKLLNWSLLGGMSAKGRELHAQLLSFSFAFSPILYPINLLRLCLQLGLAINHYLILFCLEKSGRGRVPMGLQVASERSETSLVVSAPENIAKIKLYGEGSKEQYRKILCSQSPMDTIKSTTTYLTIPSEGDPDIE